MIDRTPYPDGMELVPAIVWLNMRYVPYGIASLGEKIPAVVRVPETVVNRYGEKVPVTAFAYDVFAGKENVTDIFLPHGIGRFPKGAFAGCSGLERVSIPKRITRIEEGTFDGCVRLKEVFYEGTPDDWMNIRIIRERHEVEFGELIPGTPVQRITAERKIHIPGNDALLTADIHFRCDLGGYDPEFRLSIGKKDITGFFRTM